MERIWQQNSLADWHLTADGRGKVSLPTEPTPVIKALERQRQEDHGYKFSIATWDPATNQHLQTPVCSPQLRASLLLAGPILSCVLDLGPEACRAHSCWVSFGLGSWMAGDLYEQRSCAQTCPCQVERCRGVWESSWSCFCLSVSSADQGTVSGLSGEAIQMGVHSVFPEGLHLKLHWRYKLSVTAVCTSAIQQGLFLPGSSVEQFPNSRWYPQIWYKIPHRYIAPNGMQINKHWGKMNIPKNYQELRYWASISNDWAGNKTNKTENLARKKLENFYHLWS